jgi:hypothetical protein
VNLNPFTITMPIFLGNFHPVSGRCRLPCGKVTVTAPIAGMIEGSRLFTSGRIAQKDSAAARCSGASAPRSVTGSRPRRFVRNRASERG